MRTGASVLNVGLSLQRESLICSISGFAPFDYLAFGGAVDRQDKYQKKRLNLNQAVFFNRGLILSVCVDRRQTGLFIESRVPYEKVIPYKPTYQKSFVSHLNRFLYFDVKYLYTSKVIAAFHRQDPHIPIIIIIIMRCLAWHIAALLTHYHYYETLDYATASTGSRAAHTPVLYLVFGAATAPAPAGMVGGFLSLSKYLKKRAFYKVPILSFLGDLRKDQHFVKNFVKLDVPKVYVFHFVPILAYAASTASRPPSESFFTHSSPDFS